jgi:secreted trypsin-like serine protease
VSTEVKTYKLTNFTAAHCLNPKTGTGPFEKLLPREILAYFGAHNLSKIHETNRIAISPEKVKIHDNWNPETTRYDADIGILTFEDEIPTTKFIKPICLFTSTEQLSITEGTIAGWGVSNHSTEDFSPIPKVLKVPIHDNEECYRNNSKLANIASRKSFCAGAGDGTGVCFGDSGSGLFIKQGNNVYMKGIVSSSIIVQINYQNLCDVNSSAIFTNVPDYKDWIGEIVGEEKGKLKYQWKATPLPGLRFVGTG